MCLYFDDNSKFKTKQVKQDQAGKFVIRYKVVRPKGERFITPYQYTRCTKVLESNRLYNEVTSYESYNQTIDHGIHVCTTLDRANWIQSGIDVIKEVKCNIDDLVMISDTGSEEVYTKIEFVDLYDRKNKVNLKKKKKTMVNWKNVLGVDLATVRNFATGNVSKDAFLSSLSGTPEYTEVRKLVRERGANEVRVLARKALSRRNLV